MLDFVFQCREATFLKTKARANFTLKFIKSVYTFPYAPKVATNSESK